MRGPNQKLHGVIFQGQCFYFLNTDNQLFLRSIYSYISLLVARTNMFLFLLKVNRPQLLTTVITQLLLSTHLFISIHYFSPHCGHHVQGIKKLWFDGFAAFLCELIDTWVEEFSGWVPQKPLLYRSNIGFCGDQSVVIVVMGTVYMILTSAVNTFKIIWGDCALMVTYRNSFTTSVADNFCPWCSSWCGN